MTTLRRFPVLALALIVVWLAAQPAAAAFKTLAKQAILIDADSGQVLFQKNAEEAMAPSSMVKMMTVYLTFSDLASGKLKLDDRFKVSKKAWRMRSSKMFIKVDTEVKVEDLIRGIVIQSGNDAAVAMAEGLAGTESAFVERMNALARPLAPPPDATAPPLRRHERQNALEYEHQRARGQQYGGYGVFHGSGFRTNKTPACRGLSAANRSATHCTSDGAPSGQPALPPRYRRSGCACT